MGTPLPSAMSRSASSKSSTHTGVLENLLGFLGRVEVADEALIEATAEDRIPLGISETISGIARRDRSRSHEA